LLDGLADMPAANPAVREQIEREAETFGWSHVHKLLTEVDPETAAEIHPNHSQRLSRALEVYRISGKTMAELRREQRAIEGQGGFCERYNLCQMAIAPRDRATLHQRIALRFKKMLDQGLVDEVRKLYKRGDLHPDLPAIRAVGYRQVWDYLDGKLDYEEMIERGIIATRQLAKRQFTWLRGWSTTENSQLHWIYTEDTQGKSLEKEEIVRCSLNFVGGAAI
jgi:tRNA dimethylallyltransferase